MLIHANLGQGKESVPIAFVAIGGACIPLLVSLKFHVNPTVRRREPMNKADSQQC